MPAPLPARDHWEEIVLGLARPLSLLAAFDYDGTLVPIVERPEEARCPERVRARLAAAAAAPGVAVAVVSGRTLADLRPRVGVSGLWYAGTHGLEIEGPGLPARLTAESARSDAALADIARRLAPEVASLPGAHLERKGHSLAYHYRLAPPEPAAALSARLEEWVASARAGGAPLELLRGKMVAEVVPAAARKGVAVETLTRLLPAGTFLCYAGDDTTDEDAFAAVVGRGIGLLVAARPRPSRAAYRVENPEELGELVDAVLAARGARFGNPDLPFPAS